MRNCLLTALLAMAVMSTAVQAADISALLKTLQAVGPKGAGHQAAMAAWQELCTCQPQQLPQVLAGLDNANPLAANWIRAAVDTIAERQVQAGGKLPMAELEQFALDIGHAPRARRLAYEWLARQDSTAPDRLIPGLLHDPSIEFRYDAVQRLLNEAAPLLAAKNNDAAVAVYQKALSGARDTGQIETISKQLKELGQAVDLQLHFGFLMQWKLIGPFDNTDKKGFAVAYPPEKELNFDSSYEGKKGTVSWIDHVTSDDYGQVDLNKALGKNMGAAAYAATTFVADRELPVELRLGCINANKLWLNGKLLNQNEVYHTGQSIDQYVFRGVLKPGKNDILVKVCQNEQTDEWAQNWQFQLRVCDAAGTAILSQDRPKNPAKPAASE